MPNDPIMPNIKIGTYRHTKSGKLYNVLGVALQTETEQPLVIYQPQYDTPFELFARPYDMFIESVELEGRLLSRFEYIGD